MSREIGRLLAIALVGLVAQAGVGAQGKGAAESTSSKWAVVKVNAEIKVVASSEVPALRKSLEAEWKEAMRRYDAARKEAAAANEKFTGEKPSRPALKVLKDGLKTEEAAKAARDDLAAREEKKGEAPQKEPANAGGGGASWLVVKVGEEHRVIEEKQLKQLKSDVVEQDKQRLDAYDAAKKAAQKAKQPFTEEKPKKTAVTVVKKFATEAEAKDHAAKAGSGSGEKAG